MRSNLCSRPDFDRKRNNIDFAKCHQARQAIDDQAHIAERRNAARRQKGLEIPVRKAVRGADLRRQILFAHAVDQVRNPGRRTDAPEAAARQQQQCRDGVAAAVGDRQRRDRGVIEPEDRDGNDHHDDLGREYPGEIPNSLEMRG